LIYFNQAWEKKIAKSGELIPFLPNLIWSRISL